MSEEKCPRCCGAMTINDERGKGFDCQSVVRSDGWMYQTGRCASEEKHWQSRAEKAEAEAFNARRNAAIADEQARNDRAELAKREKALNYLYCAINYDDPRFLPAMLEAYAGLNREESIKHAGIEIVEGFDAFAEWLKNREAKS